MNSADNEAIQNQRTRAVKTRIPCREYFSAGDFSYIAYLSHRRYLRQNKRCLYQYLFLTVKLDAHLREIDHAANEMFAQLTKQMTAAAGVTEALKAAGRMEWVRRTNSIRSRVREIVNSGLIYN